MPQSEGMNYAPKGKPAPVVKEGEFVFAAVGLDHGHIYGQCNGLTEAGATLRAVYDPDPAKVAAFVAKFPQAKPAPSLEAILDDPGIQLVAAAAVPCDRGPLGVRVMKAGKDYFTDKTPFTSLDQLDLARATAARTGKKYMVYYSERLHVECAVAAGDLIADGAIGRVVQVAGFGPHRLGDPASRPGWFFEKAKYGGILCDIGSHQIEQYLFYSGAQDATVTEAAVANYGNPGTPELEDYGHANLVGDNGTTNHFRVDWLTPAGLRTWGDGRTLILGTKGYIELRKYIDVGREGGGDQLYLVNGDGEKHLSLAGQVGFPFFGRLIVDCLNRTETAMTQKHAFKAAELCLKAQMAAKRLM
ncbi:Predicted dehydrogenase [Verrucomicrobium sp. GAS474]|uniref:Gfo/Idh/MocA family protein n=1 Tax=Verrucomicrobium sp. GAS474 TaxID=1882831 RepID=UPI00087AA5DC|nr:Gfo/Idh/MocA family oxidoreductase [Verrucomicrobium sp. GAS474]SDU30613.1 Predicted dehydrogenase [Verrucomicrobium sp. GAS474]